MEKDFKILFVLVGLILIISGSLIFLSAKDYTGLLNLSNDSEISNSSQKILVVASVLPQKEFVDAVGGDKVQTVIMVPPGADPHTYEPKASQLQQMANAVMYVQVGSGIEFELSWMDKIQSFNQNMYIINGSKGINLIKSSEDDHSTEDNSNHDEGHGHSESDPHVWVSPLNAMIMVENIYQGLVKIDPKNKEYYLINKENYIKKLSQLDKNVTSELSDKKGTKILVYHPSWGYFCQEYGLTQIAIEKEGKDPTPKGMAILINQAKKDNIKVIFISPQYNTRSAEVIASEIGGKVVSIDELAPDYLNNMNHVVQSFKNL
ncbi:MAG: zinc ABC transporter substrate-binding protein [Methanobacteriaceae archaeon]|nr:zinc ABC transporter substrate-binding protein [Methanobacteriaceae archaeon]